MANATININANGLGTVFNKQTHDGWCEWYFRPNDNAKIAWEWSYVCDITYKPEMERDPDHYTGTARWGLTQFDGEPVLYDQYSWGTASYFDTVNVTIDIRGTANSNLLPHSVEPNGSGRYDYFWGWDRSSQLSDGTTWYWKVHAEGDYELSDITNYYYADGGGTGESRSTYSIHTLSARGTTTQQLQKDWQYNKIFRQTVHCGIPHLSVTLDPNDSNYTPVQHLSPSCVYLRCKEGDTYGELPTPVRPGYQFNGWFTARSGRRKYGPLLPSSALSTFYDHTIYADWTTLSCKITASYQNAKNGAWLSSCSEVGTCHSSPALSALELNPHLLSSVTISSDRSYYFSASDNGTRYNTLSLLGTGECYIYDYDEQKGIYHNFDSPHLFTYESYGYTYHSTDYIYPVNGLDLTVMVKPKAEFTYLPMYRQSNGILLRGVKVNEIIRDQ